MENFKKLSIVLADDNSSYRKSLRRSLEFITQNSIEVIDLENGAQVLDLVRKRAGNLPVAFIIDHDFSNEKCDYQGPSGAEVSIKVKQMGAELVVLNTGLKKGREELFEKMKSIGVEMFLESRKIDYVSLKEIMNNLSTNSYKEE